MQNCYTTAPVVEAFLFVCPPTHSSCRPVAIETTHSVLPFQPISILGRSSDSAEPRQIILHSALRGHGEVFYELEHNIPVPKIKIMNNFITDGGAVQGIV